jgi:cyclohexadienyl dehydratase
LFSFLLSVAGCHEVSVDPAADDRASEARLLEVGTSGDYPPFSWWPAGAARPEGFSIAIAETFARETNSKLDWVRFRWPELASDLESGRFDVALSGVTIRPERSARGRFSLPLVQSGAIALVRADSPIRSDADLDHAGMRVAVNAGGHLERVARSLLPTAQIEAIADNGRVLDRLATGAADAVLTDSIEAPVWQRRSPIALRSIGPLTRDSKAAWFAPDREAEAIEFDRWLLEAEKSGQLDRLRRQYGLPTGPTARALPALLERLRERLSLMPAVADAKLSLGKPIEDSGREVKVLDAALRDVERAAAALGVSPPDASAVRRLFRAQIEAAKWIQAEHVRTRSAGSPAVDVVAQESAQAALDESIRPALLYLGNRIAMLLVVNSNEPPDEFSFEDLASALEDQELPETHLRALYGALREVIGTAGPSVPTIGRSDATIWTGDASPEDFVAPGSGARGASAAQGQ